MKNLYNLKLHEDLSTDFGICIMRVPGGWIYDSWDKEKDCFKQGLFIPFNTEFIASHYQDSCSHIYDDFNGFPKCIYCGLDEPEKTL
jgi:hypothetical protein